MSSTATSGLYRCALLSILVATASAAGQSTERFLVRPPDQRQEYSAASAELQPVADAVCAIVDRASLTADGDAFILNADPLSDMTLDPVEGMPETADARLCTTQPYADQPTAAACTATLIAPDVVVTAGHCFRDQITSCRETDSDTSAALLNNSSFVFDYRLADANTDLTRFTAEQVYNGIAIIGRELGPEQTCAGAEATLDWAVVRLDRPVAGRTPIAVNTAADPTAGTPIITIGFPAGLPLKVSGGGTSGGAIEAGFQVDGLDVAGGNSGGSMFRMRNDGAYEIVGVQSGDSASGEDFLIDLDLNCIRETVCPADRVCEPGLVRVCSVNVAAFQAAIRQATGQGDGMTGDGMTGDGMTGDGMNGGGTTPTGMGPCGTGSVALLPAMLLFAVRHRRRPGEPECSVHGGPVQLYRRSQ